MVKQRRDRATGTPESFDSLFKRFRAEVSAAGTLREVRIHEYYMSPKERRAEKTARNQKRLQKLQKRNQDK